ncbi:MAG: hypothetical protein ABJN26_02475 [Stappiaceae bacterium]
MMAGNLFINTSGAALLAIAVIIPGFALGGEVDVVDATARKSGGNTWTFSATLLHDDTGWDHYADRWDVVGPDGTVFGSRTLAHPHENEQPFTRSLSGVSIPEGVTEVRIIANDSVHGTGGKEFVLQLQN